MREMVCGDAIECRGTDEEEPPKRLSKLYADCKFAALFSYRFSSFVCEKYLLSATSHFSVQWGCLARGLACTPLPPPMQALLLVFPVIQPVSCDPWAVAVIDAICVAGRPDGHMGH